jgi:hypothetical protein
VDFIVSGWTRTDSRRSHEQSQKMIYGFLSMEMLLNQNKRKGSLLGENDILLIRSKRDGEKDLVLGKEQNMLVFHGKDNGFEPFVRFEPIYVSFVITGH